MHALRGLWTNTVLKISLFLLFVETNYRGALTWNHVVLMVSQLQDKVAGGGLERYLNTSFWARNILEKPPSLLSEQHQIHLSQKFIFFSLLLAQGLGKSGVRGSFFADRSSELNSHLFALILNLIVQCPNLFLEFKVFTYYLVQ